MNKPNAVPGGRTRSRFGQLPKKVLVSLFAVLNLCCVLFANEPDWAQRARARWAEGKDPWTVYRVEQLEWYLRTYSYYVGLDNYWTLFSSLPRFNYWYVITADYTDGSRRLLPLPLQGKRSFMQRYFFDFRAAKYYLNIYNHQPEMERYERYLCRQFPGDESAQIVSVKIELYHQNIYPREVALERGSTHEPQFYHRTFSEVSCLNPS